MKKSIIQSAKSLQKIFPILIGMLLLIGLLSSILTPEFYETLFGNGNFYDSCIGAFFGSISVGAPVNSYILGEEFLKNGVGIIPVTTFIVTWASVGVLSFPFESKVFGAKFAFFRNLSAFIFSFIVASVTYFILQI